ncbi:helix-turn-helix domain-containing protein [Novosphingobium profundi]|uniref:helix-turn-helix domain-containing protein n=1 Tax=Novosphingobium profundi TaxID=1774954 RepID=UPI001BD97FE5|nr:helix-turn-helix domain-containing protein [Novosphingobium profundi]MBT0670193.1 helix-turn-helix domain-containing protein [Novosphingobium profundi]
MIRSLSRSIQVIQAINRHGSLGLTEISRAVDIPYPTAYRIVNTLMDEGLIEREPTRKRYRPTALIQTLSCGFQNHDRLVGIGRPLISAFTQEFHWPLSIVTRVGNKMVVRDSTSTQTTLTFNNYYPGWQVPLLASASGQVYCSFTSRAEQQELINQAYIKQKKLDAVILRDFESGQAQQRIRELGYAAVARTPYSANPGKTSSIAVPLFENQQLLGSLALVYFANSMPLSEAIERYLDPMLEVARQIGRGLEASPVGMTRFDEAAE